MTLTAVLVTSWLGGGVQPAQASDIADPGIIHLSVVDSTGHVPASVGLAVTHLEGTTWRVLDVPICSTCTPIRIGPLPAGTYRIGVKSSEKIDGRLRYLPEWLGDTHPTLYSADLPTGAQVEVTSGGVTDAGTVVLDPPGSISGTLTDQTGQPIAGAGVRAHADITGAYWVATSTDAHGAYRLDGLPPASYTVQLGSAKKSYVRKFWSTDGSGMAPVPVPVALGQTVSGIDAQLPEGGTVAGHVTGPGGTAVSRTLMGLYRLDDGTWKRSTTIDSTGGDSTGAYAFHGVPAGTYRMAVSTDSLTNAPDAMAGYYPQADTVDDATSFDVVAGETTTIDPQLRGGGHIEGRVLDSHGDPVVGAHAVAYVPGKKPTGAEKRATTDADGDYTIVGLAGAYRVGITGPAGLQSAWVGGGADQASAPDVDVTLGSTTDVADVAIPDAAYVTGTITDASGSPLTNVWVTALDDDGVDVKLGVTDAAGEYRLGPLNAGSYTVEVSDQARDHVGTSHSETLEAGQTTTFDAVLAARGDPQLLTRPAIAGDAVVGSTLSGYQGEWDDISNVVRLQWLRNGKPFGQVLGTYEITALDVGARLSLEVTATLHGRTTTVTTAPTSVIAKAHFTSTPKPTISDRTPAYGQLLKASVTGVVPAPSGFTWRWYRDGRAISGATGSSHRVSAADHGARLSVAYVPVLPGYQGSAVSSLSTGEVHRTRPTVTWSSASSSARRLTLHVTLSAPGVPASLLDGSVSVNRSRSGSDRLRTATISNGKLTVTITGEPKGRHTYYVNFLGRRDALAPDTGAHTRVTIR